MKEQDIGFLIDKEEWDHIITLSKDLPPKIGQNAFGKSIDESINGLIADMKKNISNMAENETPMLSKSLMKRRKRKYEPTFWVGAVAVDTGKEKFGAFYWNMVEAGHRVVTKGKVDTGKKVKAMRYALSAFEAKKNQVTAVITKRTIEILEKAWKKKR